MAGDLHWNTSLGLVGGLVLVSVVYRLVVGPLRDRLAPGAPFPLGNVLMLDGFLVGFYLAVGSPLDDLADRYLFSAHMFQHVVIVFVLPFMLIRAVPPWIWSWAARRRDVAGVVRFWTRPVIAFVIFNLVFTAWHVPGAYEWALRDRQVHEVEHLLFLGTAVLMWWPVVGTAPEFPRLPCGSRMLYLFVSSVAQIPMFGFLALTDSVYYPTYEGAPRIIGISPVEDQVLGAVIMKLGGEVAFGVCLVLAFLEWYRRESAPRCRRPEPAVPILRGVNVP